MQCSVEHQAHSFIIDTSGKNWAKYEIFNENELNEINLYNQKQTPEMPKSLRDYLNQFNKTTISSISKEIFKKKWKWIQCYRTSMLENMALQRQALNTMVTLE